MRPVLLKAVPTSPALTNLIDSIKAEGRGRKYDCILGLSGGVDSSLLAIRAVQWGLRPLVIHVDAGWNSEIAVSNIRKIVSGLDLELFTHVVNWPQMRDVQSAFLRGGEANLDVPQDHAFFAALYTMARNEGVSTVLSGSNYATESVLPSAWGYDAMDGRHLRAVHALYGTRAIPDFPVMSLKRFRITIPHVEKIRTVAPLNYVPYSRNLAVDELGSQLGWRDYGGKHYESRWTRYFQGALLPFRFGYDKRKAHLSSRVLSNEISREEALHILGAPLYAPDDLQRDEEFIAKKLGLSAEEFVKIKNRPLAHYTDYPNDEAVLEKLSYGYALARKARSIAQLPKSRVRNFLHRVQRKH